MIKNISVLRKYYKKIKNYKFLKKTQSEKSKLYIKEVVSPRKTSSFRQKRTSFQFLKTKLEFQNQEKNPKKYYIYYLIIGIFLIISTLYVMMFTHYFSLKSIDIIRLDENVNIELAGKSIDNFRFQPILLVKKDDLRRNIFSHQPNIKNIQISKILPSNIKITLGSHDNKFIFEYENKEYIITQNGIIIPQKEPTSLPKINIFGLDTFGIIDYKKYFDEAHISNISTILSEIQALPQNIEIQTIQYYKKEREVHIIDQNNVRLLFHINQDPIVQVKKLSEFYTQYLSKVRFALVYIDLRVNERIIYCSKETEFQCNENIKFLYE